MRSYVLINLYLQKPLFGYSYILLGAQLVSTFNTFQNINQRNVIQAIQLMKIALTQTLQSASQFDSTTV